MKNPKSNFQNFQNEKLVAAELKVIRGGDGETPADPTTPSVDPGKNNGGNGNT
ncbi:rSAM-modified peptide [Flavobacterium johnsoniae]|uniref:rSAM-modified peptide n=1 Tax=Flavobacterium johnsoniae TaxID=986 RepID=UPI0025AF1090|nr:rSAM-modified peptide [Flavobacterium johnsoniae]WJS96005.1 rSAM-modified peptide [Flavobacterium johnsoniae]